MWIFFADACVFAVASFLLMFFVCILASMTFFVQTRTLALMGATLCSSDFRNRIPQVWSKCNNRNVWEIYL